MSPNIVTYLLFGFSAVAFVLVVIAPRLWPVDPKHSLREEDRTPEQREVRRKTLEHYQFLLLTFSVLSGLAGGLWDNSFGSRVDGEFLGGLLYLVVLFLIVVTIVRSLRTLWFRKRGD